jgi:hypothetical protein
MQTNNKLKLNLLLIKKRFHMKKILLFAAAAAMVFTSCMKEGGEQSVGQASISVKLVGANGDAVRAIETPSGASVAPSVGSWYVFVLDGENVIHREDLTAADVSNSNLLNDGALFDASVKIYVLANVPSDVTVANLTTWTAIKEAVSLISYSGSRNVNYLQPAMANADGALKALTVSESNANEASVNVSISPLYARIEVLAIASENTTTPATTVTSFAVDGVWLSDYWTGFNMVGEGKGDHMVYTAPETGPADFDWTTLRGDIATTPWSATGTSPLQAVPATGNVWAYHVGAGLTTKIIVRLSSASGTPPIAAGANYLTVTGYDDLTSGSFERGKIYRMTIKFNHDNLKAAPVETGVGITATVTVQNWVPQTVTPIIPAK